jgi:hypothetical protein
MRRLSALLVLSALALGGPPPAQASRLGQECPTTVPEAAQRVFDDLVSAFRNANAKGIVALMERGRDARLVLSLLDVPRAVYASAQALDVLENTYFKNHKVASLTEAKDCPKGGNASFSRSYVLTTKSGTTETTESLSVRVHRIDLDKKTSVWVLESLESTILPRK